MGMYGLMASEDAEKNWKGLVYASVMKCRFCHILCGFNRFYAYRRSSIVK